MKCIKYGSRHKALHGSSVVSRHFGNSSTPPLTEQFPIPRSTLQQFTTRSKKGQWPVARQTTLPSGLQIVSHDETHPVAHLGVFIATGSRYEDASNHGINHFLERLALKSTTNQSAFQLSRELAKRGNQVGVISTREHTMYNADCLRDNFEHAVQCFGDVLGNSLFLSEEVEEAKQHYNQFVCEMKQQEPDQLEATHAAAYGNSSLGLPLFARSEHLDAFTSKALKEHTQKFWTADRMVVSATGVKHDEVVDMVTQHFANVPASGPPVTKAPAQYIGGDVRMVSPIDQEMVNFTLGFEGVDWHSDDLSTQMVLSSMMGGGGSFSAGGPGKGMFTRLYRHVLNGNPWVVNAQCDSGSIYEDSSIFSITGTAMAQDAQHLVIAMLRETMAMTGPVSDVELSRAKNQLKSSILMHIEASQVAQQDLGTQVLTYGYARSPDEWTSTIDSVTSSDIQRIAEQMLRSPLTTVAMGGGLDQLPSHDQIAQTIQHYYK